MYASESQCLRHLLSNMCCKYKCYEYCTLEYVFLVDPNKFLFFVCEMYTVPNRQSHLVEGQRLSAMHCSDSKIIHTVANYRECKQPQ